MSILDASRRTTGDETDFFQTLPCQIKCLCDHVDFSRKVIIDAGAGMQRIANAIKDYYPDSIVLTAEKNQESVASEIPTFSFESEPVNSGNQFPPSVFGDFLDVTRKVNTVVSNPPYSQKDAFIQKSLELADDVFMLFPLQVINYIDFCETWLDNPLYRGRILMYPKVILNPEGSYVQGGNTGYAWFYWSIQKPEGDFDRKFELIADIRKYR